MLDQSAAPNGTEEKKELRVPTTSSSIRSLRNRGVPVLAVLDVGVQVGSPELCASCPDVPHVLFEPVVEFQEAISYNYRAIKHELVVAAVSDRLGETHLEVSTVIPGQAVSHSQICGSPERADGRKVPLITLDKFLSSRSDISSPYLLKIDIDGLELAVLAGARKTLARCSLVIVEMKMENFYERSAPILEAGLRLIDIVDLAYYRGIMRQVDAVFIHDDFMPLVARDASFDYDDWQNFET